MVREVTLTWPEVWMGMQVGVTRKFSSLRQGRNDHGFGGSGWSEDVEGALAELAVAKELGIYWAGDVDTFKAPDLPGRIQVRSTTRPNGCLIVRERDDPVDLYVLVTGEAPTYQIRGWIRGFDALHDRWVKAPNNRPPAWFVPADQLNQDLGALFDQSNQQDDSALQEAGDQGRHH